MDAVVLLRNRVAGVNAGLHGLVDQVRDVDWAAPALPGTSPIGLTLWHVPRTQDWLVHTTVRGTPEVGDRPEFAELPDPESYGFGTGLTEQQARAAAGAVEPDLLLRYADAVAASVDEWLAGVSAEDLDEPVAEFTQRQQTRRAYSTPGALADLEGLAELPLGVLLVRPGVSHCLWHMGEVEVLAQVAAYAQRSPGAGTPPGR